MKIIKTELIGSAQPVSRWWGLLPDLRIDGIVAATEAEAREQIIAEIVRRLQAGDSGLLVERE